MAPKAISPECGADGDRARSGGSVRQAAGQLADHADDDHEDHRAGEQVGGRGEDPPGLPDAAQVAQAHDGDRRHGDDEQDLGADDRDPGQRRERGHDGRAARGRLHRHRDHVVDQQRDGGHLGDPRAEVLPGHDVRAARPGVDGHHLAVGQDDEHDAGQDQQRHRQHQREGGQAEERQQRVEDLLGAVGRGGQPVAGQHAQRQRPGQPLVRQLLGDQRRPEDPALDRVPEPVGHVGRLGQAGNGPRAVLRPSRPGPLRHPHADGRHLVLLFMVIPEANRRRRAAARVLGVGPSALGEVMYVSAGPAPDRAKLRP